jgi:hypothetical protein
MFARSRAGSNRGAARGARTRGWRERRGGTSAVLHAWRSSTPRARLFHGQRPFMRVCRLAFRRAIGQLCFYVFYCGISPGGWVYGCVESKGSLSLWLSG